MTSQQEASKRSMLGFLVSIAVFMFIGGSSILIYAYFALCTVPPSDNFDSELANGPSYDTDATVSPEARLANSDEPRLDAEGRQRVTVECRAAADQSLPVRFWAEEKMQEIVLGERVMNVYHFENNSPHEVHFRPIHKIGPTWFGLDDFFKMSVCFCFQDQTIEPFGSKDFEVEYRLLERLEDGRVFPEGVQQMRITYELLPLDIEDKQEGPRTGYTGPWLWVAIAAFVGCGLTAGLAWRRMRQLRQQEEPA